MQEMTLWGRANSANVQKAVWALEELKLPYRRVDVGGKFGGLDTPEYGKLNPNRLIPVLKDGDLTLWESHAIVRYLAAQYGAGGLWPTSPVERALCDQWTDWVATSFQSAWIGVFMQLVRTAPSKRDQRAVDAATDKANAAFAILDSALKDRAFICGDKLTYADIPLGAALYRWSKMDVKRTNVPHVDAWHARLRARPAFVKGVEVDFSDLVAKD